MISENTSFVEMYKNLYYEEREISKHNWEKYSKESSIAASLTGYLSGMAKWNVDILKQDRINILNLLIETYENREDSFETYSRWISEWKEFKEELEK